MRTKQCSLVQFLDSPSNGLNTSVEQNFYKNQLREFNELKCCPIAISAFCNEADVAGVVQGVGVVVELKKNPAFLNFHNATIFLRPCFAYPKSLIWNGVTVSKWDRGCIHQRGSLDHCPAFSQGVAEVDAELLGGSVKG